MFRSKESPSTSLIALSSSRIASLSITDNEETVDKFLVNSYSDLLSKLNLIDLRNGWITHVSDNNPLFFIKIIILETGPFIDRSVLVDDNLYIKAFDNKNATIPISRISINDTRQVETIIYEVDTFSPVLQTNSSQIEYSINNHVLEYADSICSRSLSSKDSLFGLEFHSER